MPMSVAGGRTGKRILMKAGFVLASVRVIYASSPARTSITIPVTARLQTSRRYVSAAT